MPQNLYSVRSSKGTEPDTEKVGLAQPVLKNWEHLLLMHENGGN